MNCPTALSMMMINIEGIKFFSGILYSTDGELFVWKGLENFSKIPSPSVIPLW